MNSFKKIIILIFLPLLVFSGCKTRGPSMSADSNLPVSPSGSLLMLADESRYGRDIWEYIYEAFSRSFPDIHILFEFTKNGAPPDVTDYDLIFLNTKAETDAVKKQLCDITGWYRENKQIIIADVLNADKQNFSVPLFLNMGGLWYGKKVFEDYGLAVPKNWMDARRILEHFPQKKLAAAGSSQQELLETSLLLPAVYSAQPSGDMAQIQESEEYKAVSKRLKYLKENNFVEILEDGEAVRRWLYGEYWFLCGELWQLDELRENGAQLYQLDFLPGILQDEGKDQVLLIDSASISVTKSCENREAAYKFLEFLFSNESLNDIVEKTDVPVAVKLRPENEMSDVMKNVMRMLSDPEVKLIALN